MPEDSVDKLQACISFIIEQIKRRNSDLSDKAPPPFFLGISGVQGIGKTSLVSAIARLLKQPPYYLHTAVLSLDDFYLSHNDQLHLAAVYPNNPLIQHRGQPSTHDLQLAVSVLSSLRARRETKIPSYDKSACEGQGDRVEQDRWATVNGERQWPIDIVILEGWCLGFRELDDKQLTAVWEQAVKARDSDPGYPGRLGHNRLEDVRFVNRALQKYDAITSRLDALIHLDAENPLHVYEWRLEQEASLRQARGSGMTDAEVVDFVNGYYPSYELFTERLRLGAFDGKKGKQLRLVLGRDRGVKQVAQV
ncbi:MAG: hypothetical protein LQ343_002434 [Gyalolechia ehrenbergii]|nr:MAG: hypothetical protein LQ343_002434 [Gyalolechia ehrenbergii]